MKMHAKGIRKFKLNPKYMHQRSEGLRGKRGQVDNRGRIGTGGTR